MLELIRKTLLAGLGAGVITKEKAQQVAQELVDEGKLAAEDAKQFVDRLLEGANQQPAACPFPADCPSARPGRPMPT